MKNNISALLKIFILLAVIVVSVIGCNFPDSTDDNIPSDRYSIKNYSIVRSDMATNSLVKFTSRFKSELLERTDTDLRVITDYEEETQYEILIGETNRKESVDAIAELDKENSYVIKAMENKIVIAGKTENATVRALKIFIDEHVDSSEYKNTVKIKNGYSDIGTVDLSSEMLDNFVEVSTETTSYVVDPGKFSSGIIQYPSMVKLSSGTMLATYENYSYKYVIHRSTDDGKTWENFSSVTDTLNKYVAEWMPHLFELPVDMGEYKAGTVILAGTSKNIKDNFTVSTITLHASTDEGETWNTICNVDIAGALDYGVWEPFLIYDEDTKRLYCFYSDDSDPEHSQKLVYKYTTDLKNWVGKDNKVGVENDPKECLACNDSALRPGMVSITEMGNGEYVMTYEMVGFKDNQVYFKKTADLDNWGDVSYYGKPVMSTDGYSFGSSPWCAWTPYGGDCGTLVVVGKHPVPYETTEEGAKMLLSFDCGDTFVAIDNPIPYSLRVEETHCGYSPYLVFSEDGKTLYYLNNQLTGLGFCQRIVFAKVTIK